MKKRRQRKLRTPQKTLEKLTRCLSRINPRDINHLFENVQTIYTLCKELDENEANRFRMLATSKFREQVIDFEKEFVVGDGRTERKIKLALSNFYIRNVSFKQVIQGWKPIDFELALLDINVAYLTAEALHLRRYLKSNKIDLMHIIQELEASLQDPEIYSIDTYKIIWRAGVIIENRSRLQFQSLLYGIPSESDDSTMIDNDLQYWINKLAKEYCKEVESGKIKIDSLQDLYTIRGEYEFGLPP